MKPIVIFGLGDIAEMASFYFENDATRTIAAFTVDSGYMVESCFQGKPVVPFEEVSMHYPPDKYNMFIALSYSNVNKLREMKYKAAKAAGYEMAKYISSRCSYMSNIPPGENCFILEDNTVQPFVRIGCNVTLWSGNHIGHHSVIEDNVFVSSHVVISGRCHVESNCFLGVNSTLRNSIRIKRESIIGAGAIIMKDTVEKGVYLADRAKLFSKSSDQIEI